eukprot:27480-Pyramimonas_sp.AAC.1
MGELQARHMARDMAKPQLHVSVLFDGSPDGCDVHGARGARCPSATCDDGDDADGKWQWG